MNAAAGGHLDVLKWALENGCQWTALVLSYIVADLGARPCYTETGSTIYPFYPF